MTSNVNLHDAKGALEYAISKWQKENFHKIMHTSYMLKNMELFVVVFINQ